MIQLHNPFSTLCVASLIFVLVLFKLVIRWTSDNKSTYSNLPPGPWTLPLIGNIHQLIIGSLDSSPHHFLRNLAAKYGPLMHLKLGELSQIVVTSPEIAEHIIKTQDINFSDRPNLRAFRIVTYNNTDIAFSPYGEYWRQLRKICTLELLSAKRVQSFGYIREEEVSELVNKIISASEQGSVFNLTRYIYSLTSGIVARAAFGKKSRYQQLFQSTMDEQLKLLGALNAISIADLYPSFSKLLLQTLTFWDKTKREKIHRRIDRILQDIIDHRRNNNINNEETGENLLDVLLKLQQENKDSEFPLTDDNIKAIIQDMFIAGGETSSVVLEWGMSEIIKNPKVMKEAQAEIRGVFDSKGYIDERELHKLIYLKSIIKEILRLHPPVPLSGFRENREKCQINGYEIPAKSIVTINIWAIGRDPKYWDEAESFKPERFLDSQIDYRGMNFEFIPFGAGRRICPGITFATPNIELPLATLLYHFDWKLPNGIKNEELDMTESHGLSARRQNDLCLIPVARLP